MLSTAIDSCRRINGHIITLFLFTKSDIMTVVIPLVRTLYYACLSYILMICELDSLCLGNCSPSRAGPYSRNDHLDMDAHAKTCYI